MQEFTMRYVRISIPSILYILQFCGILLKIMKKYRKNVDFINSYIKCRYSLGLVKSERVPGKSIALFEEVV